MIFSRNKNLMETSPCGNSNTGKNAHVTASQLVRHVKNLWRSIFQTWDEKKNETSIEFELKVENVREMEP